MERASVGGCVDYVVVPIENPVINGGVLMAEDGGRTSLRAGNAHGVSKGYCVIGDLLDDLTALGGLQEFSLLWPGGTEWPLISSGT